MGESLAVSELAFRGFDARAGSGRLFGPPQANGDGLVIAPAAGLASEAESALAQRLAERGLSVFLPELVAGAGDRASSADLEGAAQALAALPEVEAERVAVLGAGRGGTLAFLFACHSSTPSAAIAIDAPLIYAELGPERPAQPLELALNLGCPLLAIFDSESSVPAAERERLEQVLSQFARDYDTVTIPAAMDALVSGAADFTPAHSDSAGIAPSDAGSHMPFQRVLSFLTRAFNEA